jgi:diguanylate cyclase (GGDEF)-like protein
MIDTRLDCSDPAQLMSTIAELRGEVARLEARVKELDQLAHLDSLVPLPNRRGLVRQLEMLISRVERYGDEAAMLFIDLDGLKLLNDSLGHTAGDAALIQVALLLVGGVRASDTVARVGGDEFAILLDRADEVSACETAERLVNLIAETIFRHEGITMPLSVAIGVTMIERGDNPVTVMARADQAMYRVKAAA